MGIQNELNINAKLLKCINNHYMYVSFVFVLAFLSINLLGKKLWNEIIELHRLATISRFSLVDKH